MLRPAHRLHGGHTRPGGLAWRAWLSVPSERMVPGGDTSDMAIAASVQAKTDGGSHDERRVHPPDRMTPLRCLKRRISDVIFRAMLADAATDTTGNSLAA